MRLVNYYEIHHGIEFDSMSGSETKSGTYSYIRLKLEFVAFGSES